MLLITLVISAALIMKLNIENLIFVCYVASIYFLFAFTFISATKEGFLKLYQNQGTGQEVAVLGEG